MDRRRQAEIVVLGQGDQADLGAVGQPAMVLCVAWGIVILSRFLASCCAGSYVAEQLVLIVIRGASINTSSERWRACTMDGVAVRVGHE
jgi:hypothetical protein